MKHQQIQIKEVVWKTRTCEDFLDFPLRLYGNQRPHNREEESQQIRGEHLLSSYYDFKAFVGYKANQVVIRGALTFLHTQPDTAYLGYFESVNNRQVMKDFMECMINDVSGHGANQIVGPVQASFWLGYRMRLSHYNQPSFTGEPYQLDYYPVLWEEVGFSLSHRYLSNLYQTIPQGKIDGRLAKRYQQFIEKGYQIVSPKAKDWPHVSLEVYDLLSQLYQDFPTYHPISAEDFQKLFADYRNILDFSMVKLAYYQEELVGFFITVPDYEWDVYGKRTIGKLWRILKRRHKAERYIIMYIGSHPKHLGIASALGYPVFLEIRRRKAQAIGALIHQGKVTANYVSDLQDIRHAYGLYSLSLEVDESARL